MLETKIYSLLTLLIILHLRYLGTGHDLAGGGGVRGAVIQNLKEWYFATLPCLVKPEKIMPSPSFNGLLNPTAKWETIVISAPKNWNNFYEWNSQIVALDFFMKYS